jgi:predicted unusual protein kinase regulating ubiquinone biosynthesis (AarF/ABC1/UbiB family)
MSDDFPSSALHRSGIIAKAGLKVSASYAGQHLKDILNGKRDEDARKSLNKKNAERLFKEFSRLRGTALKLAQTMSLDNAILPEEVADVMAQAQYSVPPINKALVRTLIKRELGNYPEEVFAKFEPEAMAAASIGQVHRAWLHDGTAVAVKIQYPNVRDTIQTDMGIARLFMDRIIGKEKAEMYIEEVRLKLLEETDYLNEGANLTHYHRLFSGPKFVTPQWLPEYSTASVLTMTFLEGRHMNEFLASQPSQNEKDHYGQHFWDFFHAQIDSNYTVYADAHPGNFLFMPDGRLGILDFGCVKVSPPDFFNNYIRLFDVHMADDIAHIRKVYTALDMVDPNKSRADDDAFVAFARAFGNLFLSPYREEVFDFGIADFSRDVARYGREATAFTEPRGSRHFIFVTRLHVGLYRILMQLGARVNTTESREILSSYLKRVNAA